ncbi:hypothetical protein EU527_15195 [Candidatus Thorarchaeota archaeon]|nr:MAG: hypothetical protein EU527_15195 [Candidatus Thorarchaeota archaeon]
MSDKKDSQEMELFNSSTQTKKVAVGVILIALYAILALLPMSAFIGSAGLSSILSFGICVSPLFGIILGPWRGFGFGFIAGIVATIISLPIGGGVYIIIPLTILSPAIAGLFTGLTLRRITRFNDYKIPGPIITTIFLIIIIFLYEIINFTAWWFMMPYMFAVIITIILQIMKFEFDIGSSYTQLIPFTFLGAMLDHSMMVMGSVYLLQLPAEVFGYAIFPVMIIERVIATFLGAILGFIILKIFGSEFEILLNQENQ